MANKKCTGNFTMVERGVVGAVVIALLALACFGWKTHKSAPDTTFWIPVK